VVPAVALFVDTVGDAAVYTVTVPTRRSDAVVWVDPVSPSPLSTKVALGSAFANLFASTSTK
jgi:hypothetical protein